MDALFLAPQLLAEPLPGIAGDAPGGGAARFDAPDADDGDTATAPHDGDPPAARARRGPGGGGDGGGDGALSGGRAAPRRTLAKLPRASRVRCTRCGEAVMPGETCPKDGVRAVRPPPPPPPLPVSASPAAAASLLLGPDADALAEAHAHAAHAAHTAHAAHVVVEDDAEEALAEVEELFANVAADDDEEDEAASAGAAPRGGARGGAAARNVLEPPPHNDIVYGYVQRVAGPHVTTLYFFSADEDAFILAASFPSSKEGLAVLHRKRDLKASAAWGDVPQRRGDEGFVGAVLPSSRLGTEFVVADSPDFVESVSWWAQYRRGNPGSTPWRRSAGPYAAAAPGTAEDDESETFAAPSGTPAKPKDEPPAAGEAGYQPPYKGGFVPRDLGLVQFEANVSGSRPNALCVTVRCNPLSHDPVRGLNLWDQLKRVNVTRAGTEASLWERLGVVSPAQPLYATLAQEEEEDEIATFVSKEPEWNEELRGFVMDFNGRVVQSSKKNGCLVPLDERAFGAQTTIFRFGKTSKHAFSLDYRYPMSPCVALGVATTLFLKKLLVT